MTEQKPRQSPQLNVQIPIRFPNGLRRAAETLAAADGMILSAWVRHQVAREVDRRRGICPRCRQTLPGHQEPPITPV